MILKTTYMTSIIRGKKSFGKFYLILLMVLMTTKKDGKTLKKPKASI